MKDVAKTKKQLINGLVELRQRVSDLEKSKAAPTSVEVERKLLQFSLEHASDAMIWITQDGRLFDMHEAACRSLGYSGEEILGKPYHQFMESEDAANVAHFFKNVYYSEERDDLIDWIVIRKDGTKITPRCLSITNERFSRPSQWFSGYCPP